MMWPLKSQKSAIQFSMKMYGPSPWYITPSDQLILGYKWQHLGSDWGEGRICLMKGKTVYLILGMYCYVQQINENEFLLLYQPHSEPNTTTKPIQIVAFDIRKMKPIKGRMQEICIGMKQEKLSFYFSGEVSSHTELSTLELDKAITINFPQPISNLNELLIACDSSGIMISPDNQYSNRALLIAYPSKGVYQLYPQNWFNKGNFDFGYQWITRFWRDEKSKKIFGSGIRINDFVLDESLKNIEC